MAINKDSGGGASLKGAEKAITQMTVTQKKSGRFKVKTSDIEAKQKEIESSAVFGELSEGVHAPDGDIEAELRQAYSSELTAPIEEGTLVDVSDEAGVEESSEIENFQSGDRLEWVSLKLLKPNPFNSRAIYTDEIVDRIANDLETIDDLLSPIVVARNLSDPSDKSLTILDGETRERACIKKGFTIAPVLVKSSVDAGNKVQMYKLAFDANEKRSPLCELDHCLAQLKMHEEGLSYDDLAEITKISAKRIQNKVSLARNIPEDFLGFLKLKGGEKLSYKRLSKTSTIAQKNVDVAKDLLTQFISTLKQKGEVKETFFDKLVHQAEKKIANDSDEEDLKKVDQKVEHFRLPQFSKSSIRLTKTSKIVKVEVLGIPADEKDIVADALRNCIKGLGAASLEIVISNEISDNTDP